jgi:hypothetical protein
MPKFTVTVLRHQWTQIEVEAADEDAALTHPALGHRASLARWETTLIDPIEVVAADAV